MNMSSLIFLIDCISIFSKLRDWSLIMGRGSTKREGGKFYPYEKGGGAEKVLSMLKGGTESFEVVLTQHLEVLAILMGGG